MRCVARHAAYLPSVKARKMFTTESVINHVRKATGRTISGGDIQTVLNKFMGLAMSDPELARDLIGPLPDRSTGATAYNGFDLKYLVGGASQANRLSREIENIHGDRAPLDILDFGCGAARIIRYFPLFKPQHRYHACEVNEAAVEHAKEVSPLIDARVIPSAPPTSFDDQSMDVVYAWSIWTHFDEKLGRAWLEEVHRILRPGGCALITVHTDELVGRYGTEPKLVQRMKERGGDYEKIRAEYDEIGFCFWRAYPDEAQEHGIDNETFGMAFVSEDYIRKNWTDLFSLRCFREAAPKWQDLAILVKE